MKQAIRNTNRQSKAKRDRLVSTYGIDREFTPDDLVRDGFHEKRSGALEFLQRTKMTWFLDKEPNRLTRTGDNWKIINA